MIVFPTSLTGYYDLENDVDNSKYLELASSHANPQMAGSPSLSLRFLLKDLHRHPLCNLQTMSLLAIGLLCAFALRSWAVPQCGSPATTQHLPDPPYQNYFYSDCHVDAQAVVTSPLPDSDLTIIGPRFIIAWPAGNSGVAAYFQPQNGHNGSLGIELVNSTIGSPLASVYHEATGSKYPSVGVTGVLGFNSSAELTVPILGSIRTIRDFVEGPSLLQPVIQDAIKAHTVNGTGASLTRLWLDNITTTTFSLVPQGNGVVKVDNKTLKFGAGYYVFTASFNYPQLEQLAANQVLSQGSKALIAQEPDQTTSLSFLSYTEKLLAGAWRFLTYFGRDSMISALLLNPVLSKGNNSAIEAVIGAVLERINRTDGSVCHEETIGDYATYLNLLDNITSTAPTYDYKMIDSDLYLPVLMQQYFAVNPAGKSRLSSFLSKAAGSINPANLNLTYGDLAGINANKIMTMAAPFAAPGNQTAANLFHLKEGQIVGEWRDSTYGIGGGRIPYDVNTALVPAALRSIAALARFNASIFPSHPHWSTLADKYAQVWEDSTLAFFAVTVPSSVAASRLESFTKNSTFYHGPSQSNYTASTPNITFHALSLNGYSNLKTVDVMNTDDCFRHFLLNTTNQPQLSSFLNQTALNILRPFPAGLRTSVGLVVANPALSAEPVLVQNFTNAAYHGTVVWSWQLAMMARGLELQLDRCVTGSPNPDFCTDKPVHTNVLNAYNALWDVIEENSAQLSTEVWSWEYKNNTFQVTPLGVLPSPPGVGAQTESDIRQLWSLTFLAVKRNVTLK
jgi:hypothetical protein